MRPFRVSDGQKVNSIMVKREHTLCYNHGDNNMIIKPDSIVVVYLNTQQQYHRSVYSKFEVLFQEYKMVGYIEDLGVLCCGFETVYYDMNRYVNDVMSSDIQEMTYEQYIQYYQGKLARDNPGAPVLNEMPPMIPGVQMNEYQSHPEPVREVLNSNPVLQNLSNHGVKVQILRG